MLRPWRLALQLKKSTAKALYLQIADAIIKDIKSGRLKPGSALPGSRNLAEMLNINRNTVVEALNVLMNEEWIISKERKGSFVADVLPIGISQKKIVSVKSSNELAKNIFRIQFDDGYPDSKIAPMNELARAYRQIFNRSARWQMMGYGNEKGDAEFIAAIVQMLNQQRGMQVAQELVCITRGSQMATYLTAQCLVKKGDFVMVENPGYKAAWKAFENAGATLLYVGVDEEGLIIEDVTKLLKKHPHIKAIYTTPHHQYPTTVTLSLKRRFELIRLSNEYNFTIVEDDYDNEFHYGYRPVLPICSFADLKNYVYVGTLSKVVAPALRIGFLACANTELVQKIAALRKIIDLQGDRIMEQAVLQLINDGTIKRHIKKATNFYSAKRDFIEACLNKHLKNKARYKIPDGGLAVWVEPLNAVNWCKLSEQLITKGIKIIGPDHYSNDASINGIRIGFGALSERDLEKGIRALAAELL